MTDEHVGAWQTQKMTPSRPERPKESSDGINAMLLRIRRRNSRNEMTDWILALAETKQDFYTDRGKMRSSQRSRTLGAEPNRWVTLQR